MERIVRNQEKALISQEKNLEEIEEENKKREEEIQAQNSRVDVLGQSSYQELPAQFTTEALQNLNQLLESQREQEFKESLPVHLSHPSEHRAALVTEETSLPSPSGASQAAPLGSTSTTSRTPGIPTVESTPKVREPSQPGRRDLEKEESLGEPLEDLFELVALLALVQERSGGATRKSRRSSPAPSPPQ